MTRITVHHRTRAANLPLIEIDGLRTRVDLSDRLGPLGPFDTAAPGRYARGRRVSAWVSSRSADASRDDLGPGRVTFTVDPHRVLAGRAADRVADPETAWARMRLLTEWLADVDGALDALPDDLEVHQDQPVRAKLVRIVAPDVGASELGAYAPLVLAVADRDRVAAKLLMHLALIAADGDAADPGFLAACTLAWRDQEDDRDLGRRVGRADAEAVLEAVLTEHEDVAPDGVAQLRAVLDDARGSTDGRADDLGMLLMERSEASLARIVSG